MCYEPSDRPPLPPVAGAAVQGQELTLTSADGTRFRAYGARAEQPTGAGMVVLPDVRGLHPFYADLAERFAQAGIDAVAIDYFGRTAGLTARDDSFDFMAHVAQTRPETVSADIASAVAHLRSAAGGAVRAVFTVGFCFGGSVSLLQAAEPHRLAGVVAFYGWPLGSPRRANWPRPIDRVRSYTCPVLALFGGADEGIPPRDIAQFERALKEAGVEHEVVTYPGAPHSFFDRRQTEFAEASADAWRRVLAFVRRHTPGA